MSRGIWTSPKIPVDPTGEGLPGKGVARADELPLGGHSKPGRYQRAWWTTSNSNSCGGIPSGGRR